MTQRHIRTTITWKLKADKRMIDDLAQTGQVHFQNPGNVEESEMPVPKAEGRQWTEIRKSRLKRGKV